MVIQKFQNLFPVLQTGCSSDGACTDRPAGIGKFQRFGIRSAFQDLRCESRYKIIPCTGGIYRLDFTGRQVNLLLLVLEPASSGSELDNDILNIVDNVITSTDTQVRWNMITKAQPQSDGDNKVILSSGSRKMLLEVVSPDTALIYILPAEGGEGEAPNPDYMRVGFTAQLEKGKEYELRVTLTPIQ